jgi:hypothetical protein
MSYNQALASVCNENDEFRTEKIKKPGFIKRWICKMAKDSHSNQNYNSKVSSRIISNTPNIDQPERAIQFTIYNANGGRVIETRRYNTKTDRTTTGLYVITSDQEFGREIDKIITMEALKQ